MNTEEVGQAHLSIFSLLLKVDMHVCFGQFIIFFCLFLFAMIVSACFNIFSTELFETNYFADLIAITIIQQMANNKETLVFLDLNIRTCK